MLTWKDILSHALHATIRPSHRVEKTDAQWQEVLTPEQFSITRKKGTERPFSSKQDSCASFAQGTYHCVCCNAPLFTAIEKYDSGSGWPSFTQPIHPNAVNYHKDTSHGMIRVEALCATCDAHLGHVFPDGPEPSKLRFCVNAIALTLVDTTAKNAIPNTDTTLEKIVVGGGCFWCVEAVLQRVKGVEKVVSGYTGGNAPGVPTYREICSGLTGHAEVVELTYDSGIISFKELLTIFMTTHDPTTLNRQGADVGTQYRSVIFYANTKEKDQAQELLASLQPYFDTPIVTTLEPLTVFYTAEKEHQNYYNQHQNQPYCQGVISPKIAHLKAQYAAFLKE